MKRLIWLFLAFAVLFGCKKSTKSTQTEDFTGAEVIKIYQDGALLGKIEIKKGDVRITLANDKVYTAVYKDDKHKYYDGKRLIYEVKYKNYGFKLRDPYANLLWKVKLYKEDGELKKIKISDNEENRNPYKIKIKDDNYVKVVKVDANDQELLLGKVKFKDGKIVIEGQQENYSIQADRFHYAYGVLLCDKIYFDQMFIIIAELIIKGY